MSVGVWCAVEFASARRKFPLSLNFPPLQHQLGTSEPEPPEPEVLSVVGNNLAGNRTDANC